MRKRQRTPRNFNIQQLRSYKGKVHSGIINSQDGAYAEIEIKTAFALIDVIDAFIRQEEGYLSGIESSE